MPGPLGPGREGHRALVDLSGRPAPIYADPMRLRQVVSNLVKNAFQATSSGLVTVRLDIAEESLTLTVSDTGKGIPPQDRERLFEPFFSTKARGEGIGLRLAFCRAVVLAHRGTIQVDSEVGKGTTFTVVLPRIPPPTTPSSG